MRYINLRFTYLLAYLLTDTLKHGCCAIMTNLKFFSYGSELFFSLHRRFWQFLPLFDDAQLLGFMVAGRSSLAEITQDSVPQCTFVFSTSVGPTVIYSLGHGLHPLLSAQVNSAFNGIVKCMSFFGLNSDNK